MRFFRVFSVVCAGLLMLTGCKKEYFYMDVEPQEGDIKAVKIAQVAPLFETIAKWPDRADEFIACAEHTLYSDYRMLLPLSTEYVYERGTARGEAIGAMFVELARNPDLYDTFKAVADQFIGPYDAQYISPLLNEYAITAAFTGMMSALSRQPDIAPQLDELAKRYLNISYKSL